MGFRDIPLETSMWNNPSLEQMKIFPDSEFWKAR